MIKTKRITVYDSNGEARYVLPHEAEILKKKGFVTDRKKKENKIFRWTKEEKTHIPTK